MWGKSPRFFPLSPPQNMGFLGIFPPKVLEIEVSPIPKPTSHILTALSPSPPWTLGFLGDFSSKNPKTLSLPHHQGIPKSFKSSLPDPTLNFGLFRGLDFPRPQSTSKPFLRAQFPFSGAVEARNSNFSGQIGQKVGVQQHTLLTTMPLQACSPSHNVIV